MRDPGRMEYILDQIRIQWMRDPDFRLGQLICCAVAPNEACPEIWSIEDEVLLNRVTKFMESQGGKQRQDHPE